MKKRLISGGMVVLAIFAMVFTQSCDKVKEAAEFDVKKDLPTQHFTLDSASTKGEEEVLYENFFDINLDSILEANGIDKGKIKNGKFKEITLTIEDPTPEMELGFVSSGRFVVSETEDFANEEMIAQAKNIEVGDISVTFDINDAYLDKYLDQSKFYFRLYGVKESEMPVDKLPLLMKSKIQFTVSPLN